MWEEYENIIIGRFGKSKLSDEIKKYAIFDLDDTIIKSNGRFNYRTGSFASGKANDLVEFKFMNNMVKFITDISKTHHIIIISNQKNIDKHEDKLHLWKVRVTNIYKLTGIPFIIYTSIRDDIYRKPRIGIFDKYINYVKLSLSSINNGITKEESSHCFYCGDAAGLVYDKDSNIYKHSQKDFSDTDYKFVLNINSVCNLNIKFIHRNEIVFNNKCDEILQYYNNPNYDLDNHNLNNELNFNYPLPVSPIKQNYDNLTVLGGNEQDLELLKNSRIIVMVGYQGSGKTTFIKTNLSDHKYISQDILGTQAKCIRECKKELELGNNIVIDNTNPSIKTRKLYIDLATKYEINIVCCLINTSFELSLHNNYYRYLNRNDCYDLSNNSGQSSTPIRTLVPTIAYNIYKKNYIEPTKEEGFDEVIKINLNFKTDDINYNQYLY